MTAADKGRADIVKTLLAKKANPSAADHQKRTALAYAQANGHTDVVDLLQPANVATGTSGQRSQRPGRPRP
jgi:ankyrin repeat protein